MKIKACIKVEDYYNYVGTNPSYNVEQRVQNSLPSEFINATVLAFKQIRVPYNYSRWYKVILVVETTKESITKMEEFNAKAMYKYQDFLYKEID